MSEVLIFVTWLSLLSNSLTFMREFSPAVMGRLGYVRLLMIHPSMEINFRTAIAFGI